MARLCWTIFSVSGVGGGKDIGREGDSELKERVIKRVKEKESKKGRERGLILKT